LIVKEQKTTRGLMLYNGASLWGRIIGIYSTLATPFFQFFTKYFLIDNNLSTKNYILNYSTNLQPLDQWCFMYYASFLIIL